MRMVFLPQTKLGKWSVWLAAMWPVLTVLGSIIANKYYFGIEAGDGLIDDLRVRPLLAVTMLLGIGLGVISLPLSYVSILKKNERSVLTFFAAFLGLFLLILLVGELFISH